MAGAPKAELWPTTHTDGTVYWYFHRVAANGEITDPSQGYTTRRSARRGIQRRWPGIKIVTLPRKTKVR